MVFVKGVIPRPLFSFVNGTERITRPFQRSPRFLPVAFPDEEIRIGAHVPARGAPVKPFGQHYPFKRYYGDIFFFEDAEEKNELFFIKIVHRATGIVRYSQLADSFFPDFIGWCIKF